MIYPKTENLWARNPDDPKSPMSPENGLRSEEVGMVNRWLVLEKIDGMNMRVIWTPGDDAGPHELRIAGRSDNAQIPGDLLTYMQEKFTNETMTAAFNISGDPEDTPESVVLFGEGYGAGIQSGGHYRPDKSFILFDVVVNGHWCRWSSVELIAQALNIETVPVLGVFDTQGVQDVVENIMLSPDGAPGCFATATPEGVIARTDPYLFDHRGNRVMFKHKVRDVKPYLASLDG